MIRNSKLADERRETGPIDCWCLHGAVGLAADWRILSERLAQREIGTRAVDLWRFLECEPMPVEYFGTAFNADASGNPDRGQSRVLAGYSMGGRLALHALLEKKHPWKAAIIIGAHPGLEEGGERTARAASDAEWASKALLENFSDFLATWDDQPILEGGSIREPGDLSRLQLRRREIARSFVDWSLGNQQPLWNRLHEIDIPVLWVVGEEDEKFHSLGMRACELMPNAKLAVAPHSGHRVPWQACNWLADTMAKFLLMGNQCVNE